MQKIMKALLRAGVSLIPVRGRSKRPIEENWSTLPTYSTTEFFQQWDESLNYGIRPGAPSALKNGDYLVTVDLDISDPDTEEEAYAALKRLIPSIGCFVEVKSGSKLGLSRHLIGTTDKPLKPKKIWRSEKKITLADGRKRDAAQIEVFSTGKQHVGPGSIHPDGYEYEIADEEQFFDVFEDIAAGNPSNAFIDSEVFEEAGAQAGNKPEKKKDRLADLEEAIATAPVDMDDDEIIAVLDALDEERADDYQQWLEVGFALHKQFPDDPDFAFELFDWFSKKSDKYDADAVADKWDTIKDDKGGRSITFRTLIKEANKNRKGKTAREIEKDADDGEDDDDKPQKDRKWASRLDMTAEGKIKATAPNMASILHNDDRISGLVGFNQFNNKIARISDMPKIVPAMIEFPLKDQINGDQWTDIHDHNLRMWFETPRSQKGYGLAVTDRNLVAAVAMEAQRNAFHPVKDWIEKVEWDGKPRMASLWSDYLGTPDDEYHRETARLFLTGAVARIYEPGMKFDFVPIMQGKQGKRKTTFVSALAGNPEWFGALDPNFKDTKKMVESMFGKWILEMPELAGFHRADVQSIKHFISSEKDNVRLSYDRRAADYKRQCVFIGTTNDSKYLLDETGNRRYWPLETDVEGEIDVEHLRKNVRQIWAEALVAYRDMRAENPHAAILPLYLKGKAAQRMAFKMQEGAMADSTADAWAEHIEEWLNRPINPEFENLEKHPDNFRSFVSIKDIWEGAFEKDISSLNALHKTQLSAAMEKIPGWKHITHPVVVKDGKKRTSKRGWMKIGT